MKNVLSRIKKILTILSPAPRWDLLGSAAMIEAQRRAEESKMKCEEQQARVNSLFSNPHPNDRQHMLKRIERLEQIIANAKPKFVINWGSSEVEYMQEVKDENRI